MGWLCFIDVDIDTDVGAIHYRNILYILRLDMVINIKTQTNLY